VFSLRALCILRAQSFSNGIYFPKRLKQVKTMQSTDISTTTDLTAGATAGGSSTAAPRRWRRWSLLAALLIIGAAALWWFLAGGASSTAVTAQPAAQQTTAAAPVAAAPLTTTVATTATATLAMPARMPPGLPGQGERPAPQEAARAPAASAAAVTIDAVAGLHGATLQPADGGAARSLVTGARLTLVARSADNAWLLTGDNAWAPADTVIAFNTSRLPVASAEPPAAPASTAELVTAELIAAEEPAADEVAPGPEESTAAASARGEEDAAADAVAPAAVTARIDTARTRGLNVRNGPGAGYARLATLAADDVAAAVGRTADGGWLELALPSGTTGWASSYYLAVDGDIERLPVTTADGTAETATETATGIAADTTADAISVNAAATPISQSPNLSIANADAGTSGLSGALVFQSSQGGSIYIYDLASGGLRQLTAGFDPAISPDGQTVAFTRQGADAGLYLIDSDGGDERRIYSGPLNMASPKWSEDGSKIVFSYAVSSQECRDMGGGRCVPDADFQGRMLNGTDPNDYPLITRYEYDLGVVAADGSGFHSLSALPSSRAPDWSAAGIVYQSSDGLQIIQDAAGADSQVLHYEMLRPADQDPDQQPGGGRIVFQQQGASHWEIWSVDANGENMVALTQPQTTLVDALPSNVAPAWSPDGAHIVFLSNREASGEAGAWRLWVMDADGSNQQPLPVAVELDYTFGAEQAVSWGR